MPRSYIDSALLMLGASSGALIGLFQESWSFVFSLTSFEGWKQLYTGTKPSGTKKIDYGSSKPIHASSVSEKGSAEIASFLGTRPAELQPEARRSPVYTSKPSLSNGSAASPSLGRDSPSSAQYAFQSTQGPIRFSQPTGSPGRPNFESPSPPPSNSSNRTPAPSPPPANPLPAALASPAAVTFSGSASPLPSPVSAPLSSTPLLSSTPPPRSSTPPSPLYSAPPPRSSTPPLSSGPPFSSAVAGAPGGGSDADRSPPGPASETFTDDDMSSTTEEIGAQPISNAGKIKKLRKRISTKLRGIKA